MNKCRICNKYTDTKEVYIGGVCAEMCRVCLVSWKGDDAGIKYDASTNCSSY